MIPDLNSAQCLKFYMQYSQHNIKRTCVPENIENDIISSPSVYFASVYVVPYWADVGG